jgi:NAD(P)H dehydrogenase (quinone)
MAAMKIFLVHAHPEPKSFTAAMKDLAVATLTEAGHSVEVSDLYAMRFQPVAQASDFGVRSNPDYLVYALEQRANDQAGALAPDIAAELDKLKRCDLLILSFPIFWFSVPAILKGWIDRVLVSGTTYGGMRFYDRGGLAGRKALVAATLGGRRHMFGPDAVHGELETMLRHLLRGTLYYVGMDVLPPFFAHHVPYLKPAERAALLEEYRRWLTTLDERAPLKFPRLDEFDNQLFRKR